MGFFPPKYRWPAAADAAEAVDGLARDGAFADADAATPVGRVRPLYAALHAELHRLDIERVTAAGVPVSTVLERDGAWRVVAVHDFDDAHGNGTIDALVRLAATLCWLDAVGRLNPRLAKATWHMENQETPRVSHDALLADEAHRSRELFVGEFAVLWPFCGDFADVGPAEMARRERTTVALARAYAERMHPDRRYDVHGRLVAEPGRYIDVG